MQRREADRGAEVVHVFGIGKLPWTDAAIPRIIEPLRTKSLRPSLVHGDAVFEEGGVPCRSAAGCRAILQEAQHLPLKFRLSDRMLRDEPRGFGAVFPRNVFSGPPVFGDQSAQACRIPHVDCFHARNVGPAQLPGVQQFLAHTEILGFHAQQVVAQFFVDHNQDCRLSLKVTRGPFRRPRFLIDPRGL